MFLEPEEDSVFKVQLNSYDIYEIEPSKELDANGNDEYIYEQVPVIRIYGSLSSGHNIMMHVHGVFPYMFIKYEETTLANISQNCTRLHDKIEKMLDDYYSSSRGKKKKDKKSNQADVDFEDDFNGAEVDGNTHVSCTITKKTQAKNAKVPGRKKVYKYIAKVEVVKGVPFYCYQVGWHLFYKISLLKHNTMNKLADLLRASKNLFEKENVKKKQPRTNIDAIKVYEAHIPYFTQFCFDYNLYGCSWINLSNCFFRFPLLNDQFGLDQLWSNRDLEETLFAKKPEHHFLNSNDYPRMANSLIEIDILASFILNRTHLKFDDTHSNINETISSNDLSFKNSVSSTEGLWRKMDKQRERLNLCPYFPSPLTNTNVDSPLWSDNETLQKHFHRLLNENSSSRQTPLYFDSGFYEHIKSASDSVRTLWPTVPKNGRKFTTPFRASSSNEKTKVGNSQLPSQNSSLGGSPFGIDEILVQKNNSSGTLLEIQRHNLDNSTRHIEQTTKQRKIKRKPSFSENQILSHKILREQIETNCHNFSNGSLCFYTYKQLAVNYKNLDESFENLGIQKIDYKEPFFSNPKDFDKDKKYEYSGNIFPISCSNVRYRKLITFRQANTKIKPPLSGTIKKYMYLPEAPSYHSVLKSLNSPQFLEDGSQIVITGSNNLKYKYQSFEKSKSQSQKSSFHNNLSQLSIELFVTTRKDFYPDPLKDSVNVIFWRYENDNISLNYATEGLLCFEKQKSKCQKLYQWCKLQKLEVVFFDEERALFDGLVELVQCLDPDILSGFEIHASSWGYVIERASSAFDYAIAQELSRVNFKAINTVGDRWGYNHASAIKIVGRHMLNIWRILRKELNLLSYTIENIVYHVLHQRMPHFSYQSLSEMWRTDNFDVVINYWKSRIDNNIQLLSKIDVLPKITEQARLIGIDFYSVIYRGSQFKVESIMGRITRSENYIMLSPTRKEVNTQKPIESISLVIEPASGLYTSPLVVLDFQSLYPSIMIAYNYCYSTILGDVRLMKSDSKSKIGVNDNYRLQENLLNAIGPENINIAPNGVMFVKSSVRKSVLAKMLTNLLDTRIMIKSLISQLKKHPTGANLVRDLNSMQLALKLILNVTYGYTAASWSGRMPCQEIADAIVETGRETLLKAIKQIEANDKWGAKVVYGDTDSLFVYFPGKTKAEAFAFGREMADTVTNSNPAPVKLKFEKVYLPSLLMAKKRYAGNMFEFEDQLTPKLDAKGIEIIRRDGNPAQQKMVEQCIRLLFSTKDLSQIKAFVQKEFYKIMRGKILVQDFCFAKEVKLGHYKSEKTMPPGAVLAKKLMEQDPQNEPQYKERVPFVVVKGKKNDLLRDRCIPPLEFLQNMHKFQLDSDYYIIKTLIPPLNRIFNLVGVNVEEWWKEIPKDQNLNSFSNDNIVKHVKLNACLRCEKASSRKFCSSCTSDKEYVQEIYPAAKRLEKMDNILKVCRQCVAVNCCNNNNAKSSNFIHQCNAQTCPVYYQRCKASYMLSNTNPKVEVQTITTQESEDKGKVIELNSSLDYNTEL
ncbi:hypothetical protein ACO0QE_002365 [Hanseniaspora vineae]